MRFKNPLDINKELNGALKNWLKTQIITFSRIKNLFTILLQIYRPRIDINAKFWANFGL
jgi:hypothetical protein